MVRRQLRAWENELLKPPGLLERASKTVSDKINSVMPAKVQQAIASAVKGTVRGVLKGIEFAPKGKVLRLPLHVADRKAEEMLSVYKKIAAAEGAGTGAGGIVLGAVDFPALIAIKMKFLFELAHIYGFDTQDPTERLYILHVFHLAFSGPQARSELFARIKRWDSATRGELSLKSFDWDQFQREYRDAIDFRKMLQLVPGIGAVVGAWANYGLLQELGAAGMNCYRMRRLDASP
jgi:hypothetical protein